MSVIGFESRSVAIQRVSEQPELLKDQYQHWAFDREVVAAAVKVNGLAIRYAPVYQRNRKMALLAISQNGLARLFLSKQLRQDPDIKRIANLHLPTKYSGSYVGRDIFFIPCKGELCKLNEQVMNLKGYSNGIISAPFASRKRSEYLRDSCVTLFEGGLLIPYSVEDQQEVHSILQVLLPEYVKNFMELDGTAALCGTGFLHKNTHFAMASAYKLQISFVCGKTCIEGGNCFLFMADHQRKAIVGELSVYLTWIALRAQGEFQQLSLEEVSNPSLESVRMARNLAIYYKQFYRVSRMEVSEREYALYFNDAKKIEAEFNYTKKKIAEELGVTPENLASIPQTKFHIDMEMFVTPSKEIVIHDDEKAVKFVKELVGDEKTSQRELYEQYLESARKRVTKFASTREKREQILNAFGVKVHYLPAVFEALERNSELNYCNGIFLEKNRAIALQGGAKRQACERSFGYITTGPSQKDEILLHEKFLKLFKKQFPELVFEEIFGLSSLIAEYQGGLHCLTFETALIEEDPYLEP
jgi:hypothetical protein